MQLGRNATRYKQMNTQLQETTQLSKGQIYIISGLTLIGISSALFFWRRGKGKSKVEGI
jgi:hypothetical protein